MSSRGAKITHIIVEVAEFAANVIGLHSDMYRNVYESEDLHVNRDNPDEVPPIRLRAIPLSSNSEFRVGVHHFNKEFSQASNKSRLKEFDILWGEFLREVEELGRFENNEPKFKARRAIDYRDLSNEFASKVRNLFFSPEEYPIDKALISDLKSDTEFYSLDSAAQLKPDVKEINKQSSSRRDFRNLNFATDKNPSLKSPPTELGSENGSSDLYDLVGGPLTVFSTESPAGMDFGSMCDANSPYAIEDIIARESVMPETALYDLDEDPVMVFSTEPPSDMDFKSLFDVDYPYASGNIIVRESEVPEATSSTPESLQPPSELDQIFQPHKNDM